MKAPRKRKLTKVYDVFIPTAPAYKALLIHPEKKSDINHLDDAVTDVENRFASIINQ